MQPRTKIGRPAVCVLVLTTLLAGCVVNGPVKHLAEEFKPRTWAKNDQPEAVLRAVFTKNKTDLNKAIILSLEDQGYTIINNLPDVGLTVAQKHNNIINIRITSTEGTRIRLRFNALKGLDEKELNAITIQIQQHVL